MDVSMSVSRSSRDCTPLRPQPGVFKTGQGLSHPEVFKNNIFRKKRKVNRFQPNGRGFISLDKIDLF
jgi:hypothetical protein